MPKPTRVLPLGARHIMSVSQFGVICSFVAGWAVVGFALGWTLKPSWPVPPCPAPHHLVIHAPPKAHTSPEAAEQVLRAYQRGHRAGTYRAKAKVVEALNDAIVGR